MQTHEHLAEASTSRDQVSQILSAASPASAVKDVLCDLARDFEAPLVVVYRAASATTGEVKLRADCSLSPDPEASIDLDSLGDALIREWGDEFSDRQKVVQSVADLPIEVSEHIASTGAKLLIVAARPSRRALNSAARHRQSSRC